jgi:hypothetical protein
VLPELPDATVVFGTGRFDVTADVATGNAVLHVSVTLQLLAPAPIVQKGLLGVRVPVIVPWQTLPFHVVPLAQPADAVLVARSTPLL